MNNVYLWEKMMKEMRTDLSFYDSLSEESRDEIAELLKRIHEEGYEDGYEDGREE